MYLRKTFLSLFCSFFVSVLTKKNNWITAAVYRNYHMRSPLTAVPIICPRIKRIPKRSLHVSSFHLHLKYIFFSIIIIIISPRIDLGYMALTLVKEVSKFRCIIACPNIILFRIKIDY